jgi:putative peptidoglycan lipid II flippase
MTVDPAGPSAPAEERPPSLGRSAAVMAVGTALSRLTGLGRLVALAYALGVTESRLADSYNIANTMPNVIYELILGGVLTSVFIPVIVGELRTRSRHEAWESVSTLVTASVTVLVALTAVAVVGAPWIIRLFTLRLSGAEAEQQQELATFFLRFFAPQIVFYGVAAVAGGLLNAHNRFAVPMFAPILNNVVAIATFMAFAAMVAGTPTGATVGASEKLVLALGTTGGVVAMALAHWPSVRRLPGRLRLRFDFRHPAVRKLARLSGWTLGYVVANQIGFSIALVLANDVQGGPTAFFVAFAFFQLPYGIAAVSIMTALVPRMSAQAVDGDDVGFRESLATGIRLMAVLLVPATAAYLVLSRPLITTLLEHGVMESRSSGLVAGVLDMLTLGLLPFAVFLLFMRAFYARQDTRTPMLINILANVAFVAVAIALFPALEVRGIALAHSASYVVGALLAGALLSRRVGVLPRALLVGQLARVVTASMLAAAVMALVVDGVGGGRGREVVQLLAGGSAGLLAFVAAAWALKVEELAVLRRFLPGR